ncbi:SDR family NAD(P)-dependent oxidoreductase [Staphylococcus schleiferi]|uniref:SDR family NAD(P)-dependent oxidoreductase n=1 Tax=Staphylococcus schleiferi TaxID=1295 RepID=UPI0024801884|nr:SDR family NAD(P)-dependent oxidoreductase [Staphylococcus schleiferi]
MQKPHFIMTGSTSGLGFALAQAMLQDCCELTLIVRDINKARAYFSNQNVHLIECDLSNIQQVREINHQFNPDIQYDGLIHCAGLGYFKSLLEHEDAEVVETYQINIVYFAILLKRCATFFKAHASVVGISSLAAFATQPYAAHYGGSKAALNHLLNALRMEQPNWHVMTVNVGPIQTPFHGKADPSGQYAHQVKRIMLQPEFVATQIIKAMKQKKIEVNLPKGLHLMLKWYQLAPRWIEKFAKPLFLGKKRKGF